ncbi:MAG: hypothetical protein CML13_08830 [Puniceicoccaceae bacterium]|nr:hypothetical protein [Puniceicoccaceae bacterium]
MNAETVLLFEDFSGDGATSLAGKTPETVASGLTGTTWEASGSFFRDGGIDIGNRTAFLGLGDFINDQKGDSDAIFEVSATIDPLAGGGNWIAVGFYNGAVSVGQSGVDNAMGVFLFRDNGEGDGYFDGSIVRDDVATGLTGAQTYGVTLDLSTWDGSTNFGSLTYTIAGIQSAAYSLTSDFDFAAVGFGTPTSGDGLASDFTLTQIPEVGAYSLFLGLVSLGVIVRRRK